jgi:ATP-dependent helicase/nuclease subunit B
MGPPREGEIDAWLRNGGLVVTASDRAARALVSAFHRARRAEGLTAWLSPNILDWKSFVRSEWDARAGDGRMVLNRTQEQAMWAEIAGSRPHPATLLEGPRHRLANLAIDAHQLLCSYAPSLLPQSARSAWQQDAAAFSEWLAAFDQTCRTRNLLSPARLPLELITLLESPTRATTQKLAARSPLLLAGFDRILPTQRSLFDAWGEWQQAELGQPAERVHFLHADDAQSELGACALWCTQQLASNPDSRLLVVTEDAADRMRRGQIERAFLKHTGSGQAGAGSSLLFEFSLGTPLSLVALPNAAHLLLRWLSAPMAEHKLDWLLSTGYTAADSQESAALLAHMRGLRRRGRQQPQWTVSTFTGAASGLPSGNQLPEAWVNRITEAERNLADFERRTQTPLEWVELVPQLLETAGFPGSSPLTSTEFQAANRWQQAVETCGSLGFDGRRIPWRDFLSMLARTLEETLFAPESRDAPIQIAGPAESAGLTADGIWFLGANEDSWPAGGATHPLLPPEVQRQAGMPHASPQLDWELAHAITTRLIASATEIRFSYAAQVDVTETRPSRLIAQLAGAPQAGPKLTLAPGPPPLTVPFDDFSRIPFPPGKVRGGASVLTSQSQCAFKAFATARLAAEGWETAEAGLTASQRGKLLHSVLHAIWAGPPRGISTRKELIQNAEQRSAFVAAHIHRTFQSELSSELRDRMPPRYLELEQRRLTSLLTEWLDFEAIRIDFEVAGTEIDRTIHLAGLTFDLRLDRIDRLNDGSLLVIDYKSGDVTPKSWELPRPDDVQLPLYAGFALDHDLGGLVFAKVRAGGQEFAGRVGDAKATLLPDLTARSSLVKNQLTAELLIDWRTHIEELAHNFLAGHAEVDPRDYPKTCERCGLQSLCRIQENQELMQLEAEEEPESTEAADE